MSQRDIQDSPDRGLSTLGRVLLLAAAGGAAYFAARHWAKSAEGEWHRDAPQVAWRESAGKGRRVGRTVTVNRPRMEVYEAWRDFSRLPEFMDNVVAIEVLDKKRSRWTVAAPGWTTVDLVTVVTRDEPGELIAWESEPDSSIKNSGEVRFRDAPGGRGTLVEARINYKPPAGVAGALAAKLFQREPEMQARRELKRFKQIMETGEVAVGI